MTEIASYRELNAEVDRQLADARKRIQSVFKAVTDDFFTKCPEAHAIGWTQGTPSWNDGESCSFSVHEPNLYLTEESLESGDSGQDILRYRSSSNDETIEAIGGEARLRVIIAHFDAVEAFVRGVDEDDMQLIFGNGSKITATKDGFEIEDYEVDY